MFSITIVALSLTSSQYTSRILVNFMGDRLNQTVLGVFVGTFAYCLLVLRTIRGGDEGAFVPSLAVLVGLLLTFVAIGLLVYFIHYISLSIQASSVIAAAAGETIAAVDELFPEGVGDPAEDEEQLPEPVVEHGWHGLLSTKTGYIETIDGDRLTALAVKHDCVVRMHLGIGEFAVEGTPLASLAAGGELDPGTLDELRAVYAIGRHRTVQQDAAFGVRQIVDIAMKALSPGVNDTTTAVMCVDYLTAILVRMGSRRMAPQHRVKAGKVVVIARGPNFRRLLDEAFDQIRHSAKDNFAVLMRMLRSLQTITAETKSWARKGALREHVELVAALARSAASSPRESETVKAAVDALSGLFATTPNGRPAGHCVRNYQG